mmetsp:Transcript_39492/g.108779  ORF Transcript_39492/g.108779 Transcript_39492/m.108779 type:complete len:224 (+) Transcript_39492:1256-1927(+)
MAHRHPSKVKQSAMHQRAFLQLIRGRQRRDVRCFLVLEQLEVRLPHKLHGHLLVTGHAGQRSSLHDQRQTPCQGCIHGRGRSNRLVSVLRAQLSHPLQERSVLVAPPRIAVRRDEQPVEHAHLQSLGFICRRDHATERRCSSLQLFATGGSQRVACGKHDLARLHPLCGALAFDGGDVERLLPQADRSLLAYTVARVAESRHEELIFLQGHLVQQRLRDVVAQ